MSRIAVEMFKIYHFHAFENETKAIIHFISLELWGILTNAYNLSII